MELDITSNILMKSAYYVQSTAYLYIKLVNTKMSANICLMTLNKVYTRLHYLKGIIVHLHTKVQARLGEQQIYINFFLVVVSNHVISRPLSLYYHICK
jgi:hypothetical protein